MIRLELAYPVSANRYWRTVMPKGHSRPMTMVSPEAKAYKAECGWKAKAAGVRSPILDTVELRIQLVPKNGICMDLDNALKVVIDALKGIVYQDDSQVRKITAERTSPNGVGGLVVEIESFADPVTPPLFPVEPAATFSKPMLADGIPF
jgi:crossover junction endodeoxyribonuclease RusA